MALSHENLYDKRNAFSGFSKGWLANLEPETIRRAACIDWPLSAYCAGHFQYRLVFRQAGLSSRAIL